MSSKKELIIFFVFCSVIFNECVYCHKHVLGSRTFMIDQLYNETLLHRYTEEPTNYTIKFHYTRSPIDGPINYIEFDINCESTATMNWNSETAILAKEDSFVTATIQVINGTNVTATVDIYGVRTYLRDAHMEALFQRNFNEPSHSKQVLIRSVEPNKDRVAFWGIHELDEKLLKHKMLFTDHTSEPTNYTIIFRYSPPKNDKITFMELELNCNGSGSLEHNNNGAVTATIHVLNGRNFTAFISIYGHGVKQLSNAPEFPSTKSFTFVYRHSRTQSRNRSVSLGQRQPNDNLLAVKRKTVRIRNRFAQDDFQYEDINHFITKITISFDSPTGMAFINTTFISEHSINAVVYDLDRPTFRANLYLYGYDSWNKSPNYVPIVN